MCTVYNIDSDFVSEILSMAPQVEKLHVPVLKVEAVPRAFKL
jgi:hypothetical protein